MKKIFYILASAIVALGAVACDNQDLDNIAPGVGGDSLSFSAVIDNTKTDLNGLETVWVKGDVVVFEGYEKYEFVYDGSANFTCTVDGVTAALGDNDGLTAWYNKGGIDSTKGTAGAQLKAEGCSFTAPSFKFEVQNAFLKFTAAKDAVVTIAGDNNLLSAASVEIIGTGAVQYVAINPKNATLSYSIGGVQCKEVNLTFAAKNIYNLGELAGASEYGVVGSFQTPTTWDVAAPVKMYTTNDGWVVARNVELYKSDEFKIVKGNTWDVSYGFQNVDVLAVDTEVTLDGSQNIKAVTNGKFDIYFNGETKAAKYVCVDEYTDLMVTITIDNKANWSSLYITLKSGETTIVENATVTGNKYAVSGDLIGESLSYTLSNGSKTMEGNVSITKDGATINLEETIIKLKVQLNTTNSKQWWGSTMKIHVWSTGTSLDTSWPGNVMTSEGNYTWSIVVPSELVGKTINYLVHNGNGWQSSNSKVTIKAEGNTVTGSSIGIN